MNRTQIQILNSLVTFAVENMPGGLIHPDEQEVAKIVSDWAITDGAPTHVYKTVNATGWAGGVGTMAEAANYWAQMGWRVVGVVSDTRPGYAHSIVLERPIGVTHPND